MGADGTIYIYDADKMPEDLLHRMRSVCNLVFEDDLDGKNYIYFYVGTNIIDEMSYGTSEAEYEQVMAEIEPYFVNEWTCWT